MKCAAGRADCNGEIATEYKIRLAHGMMRLCIFVGMTVGSIGGSMLGGVFGWGMLDFGSFLLSGLGAVIGVFAGWKVAQKLE